MKIVKLNDVCEIIAGQSPPSKFYNDQGIGLPFFQGKTDFGKLHPSVRMWCSEPKKIAEAGDILISVRAPVGPTNLADQRCCIGRGLSAIRPSKAIDTKFLLQYFKAIEPKISNMGNGSTFSAITQKDLRAIEIPLPPLAEQQRIAAILDKADALRAQRRAALAKLDTLLQATFLHLFGDPVTNPMGWEVKLFDEVCESRLGKMLDAKQQTGKHLRPYLRNANVQWDSFELDDLLEMDFDENDREKFRLESGDLLICEGGEVGRSAIWRGQLEDCYYQKALHKARVNPKLATPEYLLYYMWLMAKNHGLKDHTTSVTIAHLTGVKLKRLPVPLPSLEKQQQFTNLYENTNALKENLMCGQNELDNLFHTLQQRAFNGEL